ncbi:MAG: lasso RiPP family leader peptide-containing protein [Thermocrispum sp.]
MKQEYVVPSFEELGTVEELTLGSARGVRLDADFPAGTPFGDLSFS